MKAGMMAPLAALKKITHSLYIQIHVYTCILQTCNITIQQYYIVRVHVQSTSLDLHVTN